MKPRRVILTIEVETDAPLRELRKKDNLDLLFFKKDVLVLGLGSRIHIEQVQANVVKR